MVTIGSPTKEYDARGGFYINNPALLNSTMNNGTLISAYPSVINASMRSAYPTAALRLNSSLYFASARRSFNPQLSKGLLKGFGWGVAGAAVDAGFDAYKNSLYDDTLRYFRDVLSVENQKSRGINILTKTK